jgi:lysozyme
MTNNFTTSQNGLNLITEFEGFRSNPYLDQNNIPTIGYGSTHYEDGSAVTMDDDSITKDEAMSLLAIFVKNFENTVNTEVTADINQNQFDALIDLVYNIGPGHFANSTVLKVVNGESDVDIATAFMMWDVAGGGPNPGLIRRRQAEIDLYNS